MTSDVPNCTYPKGHNTMFDLIDKACPQHGMTSNVELLPIPQQIAEDDS